MSIAHRLLLVSALALALIAAPGQPPALASTPEAAAPAEPVMCKEHGVVEAICTKCKPALIPVFKAKGDWCDEHGFPESVCPICHPERGGKPKVDVAADAGTMVKFKTKDTARLVGIETEPAREKTGLAQIEATVTIVFDATRVAQVNARASGVVRSIAADVGATVAAGATLATVESADVGADQSRRASASARVSVADAGHRRLQRLHKEGIAPEREVLAARQELETARADLAAATSALGVVDASSGGPPRYALTSPIAGVVTRRALTVGHLVGGDETLFEIVDTSVMWAEIDVPEAALGEVAAGQPVTIALDGFADRELSGTIGYLAPMIDPRTRTILARVPLPNPDGFLRANMFGRAAIAVGESGSRVIVPAAAVQRGADDATLVFVRIADDAYEGRPVRVTGAGADGVSVTGRVKAGDPVVTTGSFLLKTETLKGSIGAGCCAAE